MIIGILSDSHGRVDRTRLAMQVFDRLGVQTIIHCGDVGGPPVLDEIVGRACHFVWGNTDAPDAALRAYLSTVGLPDPPAPPLRLRLAGKTIHVFHGHEPAFAGAIRRPQAEYILHGHTHLCRDERLGPTRIINPGAVYRANPPTVATLDLVTDTVAFHKLAVP